IFRLLSPKVYLLGSLVLGALFALARHGDSFPGDGPARHQPLYPQTQPAKNPERLTLVSDAQKVVGWISGATDHAGSEVAVTIGKKTEMVRIDQGNTFAWSYQVEKNTRAEFAFKSHKQAITLNPPQAPLPPSVYFVVDRSVYRP